MKWGEMNGADKSDDWLGRDERVRHSRAHTRRVRREDLENPMPHIDPLGWLGGCVEGLEIPLTPLSVQETIRDDEEACTQFQYRMHAVW